MVKPFISIVTYTKNSEKFLKECLDSVSGQIYRNFEHIFMDGFSQDGTMRIIEDYIRDNPDIIAKIIRSEPRGIANAMNVGIGNSQGEILHFLHSDDYYFSPDSLERVAKIFKDNPEVNAIMGNEVSKIGNKIFVLEQGSFSYLIKRFVDKLFHPNTFVRRIIFDKYGLFDETLKVIMDRDHFLRWDKKEKIVFVGENFTVFRHHQRSISSAIGPGKLFLLEDHFKLVYRKAVKSVYGK